MANFWENDPVVQGDTGTNFWEKDPVVEREEPQEEAPKEATIGGEAVKSFKQMGSAYQTAYETLAGDPEAAVRAGMKRREQFIKEYGQTRGLEEFLKVYGEDGMLAAGAEFASQVPTALAGQTATLGSMAVMGKLGAGAGAAIGTAIPYFNFFPNNRFYLNHSCFSLY